MPFDSQSHIPAPSDEELRGAFRRCGLRFTRQRASVYRVLAGTKSHPTADDLLAMVCEEEPRVSLATVYNTLDVLTESGLCRRLPGSTGSSACRYDADVRAHAHLIAESGEILDVPPDLSGELIARLPAETIDEIERRLGVRVTRVDLQLVGRIVER